jgi:hypothetical protein
MTISTSTKLLGVGAAAALGVFAYTQFSKPKSKDVDWDTPEYQEKMREKERKMVKHGSFAFGPAKVTVKYTGWGGRWNASIRRPGYKTVTVKDIKIDDDDGPRAAADEVWQYYGKELLPLRAKKTSHSKTR